MAADEHTTSDLEPGVEIELEVTGIAHGGVFIARHEGRVVFVADAMPGERVLTRITEAKKKKYARAVAVEVLDASEDRREHVWAEASIERDPDERPGGAEFGHIYLPTQRAYKGAVLADAMQRFGGVELTAEDEDDILETLADLVEPTPGDEEPVGFEEMRGAREPGLHYRTRVRLHVDPETGAVGPYAARSRRVIPVESLPLASADINSLAPLGGFSTDATSIELVDPAGDDPRMLVTLADSKQRTGEDDRVREYVEDRGFLVRAGGFWQVHMEAPTVLFAAVREAIGNLIEEERFDPAAANLDLYGGVGLFAAAMAEAAGSAIKVTTVEADAGATDDAAENLAELVGARAITSRVDRHLTELLRGAAPVRERARRGTVVLDPPRSGAGGGVTAQLVELAPANIVYVACDPVALARDTKTLRDGGYELSELRAFDLFPHTHHFESLAVFRR